MGPQSEDCGRITRVLNFVPLLTSLQWGRSRKTAEGLHRRLGRPEQEVASRGPQSTE